MKMTAKRSNIYRKNEAPKSTTPQESNREATVVFLQIFDAVGIIFNGRIDANNITNKCPHSSVLLE